MAPAVHWPQVCGLPKRVTPSRGDESSSFDFDCGFYPTNGLQLIFFRAPGTQIRNIVNRPGVELQQQFLDFFWHSEAENSLHSTPLKFFFDQKLILKNVCVCVCFKFPLKKKPLNELIIQIIFTSYFSSGTPTSGALHPTSGATPHFGNHWETTS